VSLSRNDKTYKIEYHYVMNIKDLVRGMDPEDPHIIGMDSEVGAEIIDGWNISQT